MQRCNISWSAVLSNISVKFSEHEFPLVCVESEEKLPCHCVAERRQKYCTLLSFETNNYTIKANWNNPVRIKVWLSVELNEAFCISSQPFYVTSMITASHIPLQLTVYSRLHKSTNCVYRGLSLEVSSCKKSFHGTWSVTPISFN